MTRALHGLLEEHAGIAERALRLAHGLGEGRGELAHRLDAAHTAPPAAGDGLGEDREADLVGLGEELVDVVGRGRRAQHGTPAEIAWSFAVTLLPAMASTSAGGPMKVIPWAAAFSASSGFSERKP